MTTTNAVSVSSAVGGTTAVLGGLAWLLLIPAAQLHRRDLLSYDDYNRLLAVPLVMFLVALLAAPRVLAAPGRSARRGFVAVAIGVGLLLAGNLVEFYGVLLQDEPNAYAAAQTGASNHWIGSDIGWIIFGLGMLVLLLGGLSRPRASSGTALGRSGWSSSPQRWVSASWPRTCSHSSRRSWVCPSSASTRPGGSPMAYTCLRDGTTQPPGSPGPADRQPRGAPHRDFQWRRGSVTHPSDDQTTGRAHPQPRVGRESVLSGDGGLGHGFRGPSRRR